MRGRRRRASALLAATVWAWAAGVSAQETQTPTAGGDSAGAGVRQVGDLTTRYRFVERSPGGGKTPYQVATRDVLKVVVEKPQGAPDRSERTVQVIYTERPAAATTAGQVTDTLRRYDALKISPPAPTAAASKAQPPKLLEGLTVWYKARAGGAPLLMSTDPKRRLNETEYKIIAERQVFLPDLAAVLPALPSRVGDRWRVPKAASQALFGERPAAGEAPIGTLIDVRKGTGAGESVAMIGVTGRGVLPHAGDTVLNAQLVFTFTASEPAAAPTPAGSPPTAAALPAGTVEASGAITDVRLARSAVAAVPGSNGRLKLSKTAEVTIQRKFNSGAPLELPAAPPTPTEANSWLTYEDPKGRFNFRHPQDFLPEPMPIEENGDIVQLVDAKAHSTEGRIITVVLQPKTGKPDVDKAARDPDAYAKSLNEKWAKDRSEVIRGPAGWLPDADWAPNKMKVYRIEAALKLGGAEGRGSQRIFLDSYLVLFTQNESLVVDAMTGQDPPLPFRQQVEAILKTFQLGSASAPTPAAGG